MAELTEQQKNPHPRLVDCRNSVAASLDIPKGANTRKEAAAICDQLSHKQVEAVLSAGGDSKKVLDAIKPVLEPGDRDEPVAPRDGIGHKHKGKTTKN